MKGVDVIAEILKREGTEFLSCYPRNPLIEACAKIGIRPVLCRQERVGVGIADGYSRINRGKRIGVRDFYEMLRDTGLGVLDLFMIGAAAGIIIGALNYSGVGFTLTLVLLHLAGESLWGLLILAAAVSIILGMGMPTVGVYILLATLVAPALIKLGIAPMAAHMFIMYYGCLSMITPPVAIGAFAAANDFPGEVTGHGSQWLDQNGVGRVGDFDAGCA